MTRAEKDPAKRRSKAHSTSDQEAVVSTLRLLGLEDSEVQSLFEHTSFGEKSSLWGAALELHETLQDSRARIRSHLAQASVPNETSIFEIESALPALRSFQPKKKPEQVRTRAMRGEKYLVPFNKPYMTGHELDYIDAAVKSGKISGDGDYSQKCQSFLEEKYGFRKVLLTPSCTAALEMCAILLNISPGDEVIMPSYTFVSTANAFILQGAKVVFCDSSPENPNLDPDELESLITPRTKAIVAVHYAGVACDMRAIMEIAKKHDLYVVEDAAQAIDSYYQGSPLGGVGHLGTFSFHETKNIMAGEGGALIINDPDLQERAEIIREKGTNRAAFFRGKVDKYSWVDIGSSYLPSEIVGAFLYAQLLSLSDIQNQRVYLWERYQSKLEPLERAGKARLPAIPEYATNNAHMFYIVCENLEVRSSLIDHLRARGVLSVFHYVPLHTSSFFCDKHDGRELSHCDRYSDCLLRLPLYFELDDEKQDLVIDSILDFYELR